MAERFRYKTGEELRSHAHELGLELPWSDDFSLLYDSFSIGNLTIPNRFIVHPMEGFDAKADGSPGELTERRYRRFAKGGSGLIWMEATSVTQDGRSNPAQLYMNKKTMHGFARLADLIHANSSFAAQESSEVKTAIQLSHSGRYSKPDGRAAPLISPSDDDLKRIRDAHVEGAILAERAGFDAVDIKICHGYLLHELLFARDKENSEYGGKELDKRIRIAEEILTGIKETSRVELFVRLNVFDGLEGGFGVSGNDAMSPDLNEVEEIVSRMNKLGVALWSVTAGIPYINPWLGRPFDTSAKNTEKAPEHPLQGVSRLITLAKKVSEMSKVPVVGAGLSWLRQYFPFVAAGIIRENMANAIGMGRMSFAYPDLPNDLYKNNIIDPAKVCVTCSGCTNRMREGLSAGCIIRDREVYA